MTHRLSIAACGLLIFSSGAWAQENTPEVVVVTGSFISRPADRPQPVTVLDVTELRNDQQSTPAEILKDLPITQGSIALNNRLESGVSPTSSVNLRGLGPRATLVLLNGKRQTVDGINGADGIVAVDINNLTPTIMIDRIEILTDGASALYGSDAVAGVVNFLTRRDFDGAEIRLSGQEVDRAGARDLVFGGIFGSQGETTSVVAAFEFTDRENVSSEAVFGIDRLLNADFSSFGNPASFSPGPGPVGRFADPLCEDSSIAPFPRAGVSEAGRFPRCALSLGLGRNLAVARERFTGLATVDHELGPGLMLGAEIGFARSRTENPSGFGFPIFGAPRVPANNPGIIAENARSGLEIRDYVAWHRLGQPFGEPELTKMEQDMFRFAASLDGEINDDWNWSVVGTFSQSEVQTNRVDTIFDRFQNALNGFGGPGCDLAGGGASGFGPDAIPGTADDASADINCQWYNPFANSVLASPGDPNFNDPALKDFMLVPTNRDGQAELGTLDVVVTGSVGELAGGPTGIAIGVQRRNQKYIEDWDPISNAGGFAFFGTPALDFRGSRGTDALFGEVVLFPSDTFEIQIAGRYEEYDGGLDSFDPKLGFLWTPTNGLYLRATAGTSFRAPGEVQTFGQSQGASDAGNFPTDGANIDARALTVGSRDLQPEEADTLTAGLTWDITDRFTLDLNYWSIEFTNLIVQEDAAIILNNDLNDGDGLITDPRIELRPGAPREISLLSAQDIALFRLSYINQDFLDTDGIDFNLDFDFESGRNNFGVSFFGTKTLTYDLSTEGRAFDGLGKLNNSNLGVPTPDWTGILRFDWSMDRHFARISARHIPSVEEDLEPLTSLTEEKAFTTVDLLYRYEFGADRSTSLSLGVRNVADQTAPLEDGNLETVNTFLYDPRGRSYHFALTKTFGD